MGVRGGVRARALSPPGAAARPPRAHLLEGRLAPHLRKITQLPCQAQGTQPPRLASPATLEPSSQLAVASASDMADGLSR